MQRGVELTNRAVRKSFATLETDGYDSSAFAQPVTGRPELVHPRVDTRIYTSVLILRSKDEGYATV